MSKQISTGSVELGLLLMVRRESLGFSKTDTADAVGISPSYLTRIEDGERMPSAEVLTKLAYSLELDYDTVVKYIVEDSNMNNGSRNNLKTISLEKAKALKKIAPGINFIADGNKAFMTQADFQLAEQALLGRAGRGAAAEAVSEPAPRASAPERAVKAQVADQTDCTIHQVHHQNKLTKKWYKTPNLYRLENKSGKVTIKNSAMIEAYQTGSGYYVNGRGQLTEYLWEGDQFVVNRYDEVDDSVKNFQEFNNLETDEDGNPALVTRRYDITGENIFEGTITREFVKATHPTWMEAPVKDDEAEA